MTQMVTEGMREKWSPLMEKKIEEVRGLSRKDIATRMLENQQVWCKKNFGDALDESTLPINQIGQANGVSGAAGAVSTYTPLLMNMAKRLPQNMIAFDFFGVQPMTGPDGQFFALRARFDGRGAAAAIALSDDEALYKARSTGFSGDRTADAGSRLGLPAGYLIDDLASNNANDDPAVAPTQGQGMTTTAAQLLGTDSNPDNGTNSWSRMGLTIQKTSITARSRGLYADYTHELRQDMQAIHGEDVDAILADILTQEIQAEMNQEFIQIMNRSSHYGHEGTAYSQADGSSTLTAVQRRGVYNMSTDTDGRWAGERWKSMLFRIEREANAIALETRRGRGNRMICSSNVASALMLAGMLTNVPLLAQQANLNVDDQGNTFAGRLANGIDVWIDPWADQDYFTVIYKGASQMDAGWFFAPYVPLEMYRANGEDSFQPRMAFKTRYGLAANPFYATTASTEAAGKGLGLRENGYGRLTAVLNLGDA